MSGYSELHGEFRMTDKSRDGRISCEDFVAGLTPWELERLDHMLAVALLSSGGLGARRIKWRVPDATDDRIHTYAYSSPPPGSVHLRRNALSLSPDETRELAEKRGVVAMTQEEWDAIVASSND
jgi:hypothetical protein